MGNDTLAIRDFLITHLSLRSRPEASSGRRRLPVAKAPGQLGADAPAAGQADDSSNRASRPTSISARCWEAWSRASISASTVRSVRKPDARDQGRATRHAAGEARQDHQERRFRDLSPRPSTRRGSRSRAAQDDGPADHAPQHPPEFSTDARGFLVALIHDLQLDVPAPEKEAKGGIVGAAAKIYRIKVPLAEVALSYQVDSSKPDALRVHGKVEDFNPGTNAEVLAINDDETKAVPLAFSAAIVLGALGGKLRSQSIDVPLDQLKLPGFTIRSISPLDPSGWVRVSLDRRHSPLLRWTASGRPNHAPATPSRWHRQSGNHRTDGGADNPESQLGSDASH